VSSPGSADDPPGEELLARAVAELAAATRFPVAFGGLETDGGVTVSSVVGGRTRSLNGLRILPRRGLGGRAMVEARPRLASDYGASRQITHDYDAQILGEGIVTLLAVPVVVAGRTRAMLYGGARGAAPAGDVLRRRAVAIADELAHELRVRDEVRLRLAAMPAAGLDPARQERLRASYAELRGITAAVSDPALRTRLEMLERHLAAVGSGSDEAPAPVRLTPRETDVLACAALGCTNAEIARALGLQEATVKAYLGQAMAKLDASTRHAAVVKARGAGLLP